MEKQHQRKPQQVLQTENNIKSVNMSLSTERIVSNIERVFNKKKYKFFDAPFSVNVFGIRCSTGTDEWDDVVGVAYYDEQKKLHVLTFEATTDPGTYWLKNPMRTTGCAIMVEGQYRGAYFLGPHGRKKYEACRQGKAIPVYRDNNKDSRLDMDTATIDNGIHFTNIHHGWSAKKVGKNSAGCQVIKSKAKFEKEFIPIIKKSCDKYGKNFTYTLFNKKDFA